MVEPGKHIATRASLTPVLGCSEDNHPRAIKWVAILAAAPGVPMRW